MLREKSIEQMIPYRVYRDLLSPPDAIFVLLAHMESLYARRGVDVRPLRAASLRYAAWLKEERTALRRKRVVVAPSDPFPLTRILTEKFCELAASREALARLLRNERLAELVGELARPDRVFDYDSLKVASERRGV